MFVLDNPRITAIFALAADTVMSIKAFIEDALETAAPDLFVNERVADETARLALTDLAAGYLVHQDDAEEYYQFTGTDPSEADHWTQLLINQLPTLNDYLKNISWKIKEDSSIGNEGAGTLFVLPGFISGVTPSSANMEAYGIEIAVNSERTCSGHSSNLYLYSSAGADVLVDIIFNVGA